MNRDKHATLALNLTLAAILARNLALLNIDQRIANYARYAPRPSARIFFIFSWQGRRAGQLASSPFRGSGDSHTNNLPPVELDIGGDGSLHPDTNSLKEQLTHPATEKQATSACKLMLSCVMNQKETTPIC